MGIKFKLNELFDHNTPCFTKHKHMGSEMDRKAFTRHWLAYHQYPEIAKLECYQTPDGGNGAMIILLKTDGKYYYNPFSDSYMEFFDEEEFIKLHSGGPQGYRRINKLSVGDTLKAYLYDMEYWGFLDPYESEIKVISIEELEFDCDRHITLKIERRRCEFEFDGEKTGDPIIRTIKYSDL